MFKIIVLTTTALTALSLAACGTTPTERGVTGAGIGAGIGILGGPPGILIGAAIGGAVGATTDKRDIDIGDPPRGLRDQDRPYDEYDDDGAAPDDDADVDDQDDHDHDDDADAKKPPRAPH